MNLGIIIGVANYRDPLVSLPACMRDAQAISGLLKASSKFEEVLFLASDTSSASLKKQLIDFITAHKGKQVEEVFFYYSGHGEFSGDEFFYLLSDFDSRRRKQTSLENSELDNVIRTLSPDIAIKVIDACNSGIPYIKESDAFTTYLKGTQNSFNKCYFLFSSQSDQSSYQDTDLSFFTRGVIEALFSHSGSTIRYKDIIDYVSDLFASNTQQTPSGLRCERRALYFALIA